MKRDKKNTGDEARSVYFTSYTSFTILASVSPPPCTTTNHSKNPDNILFTHQGIIYQAHSDANNRGLRCKFNS